MVTLFYVLFVVCVFLTGMLIGVRLGIKKGTKLHDHLKSMNEDALHSMNELMKK